MNKVPFALEVDTGQLVDVHEVARGLQCGCICPSCDTPLQARQGEKNAWHFAHATRGTSDQTDQECEYSFYVSVTQMAKQLFAELAKIKISLPKYVYPLRIQYEGYAPLEVDIEVTQASTVQFEKVELETKIESVYGDVIGWVHGVPLIIGFDHPERHFLIDEPAADKARAGVIRIDLSATLGCFFGHAGKGVQSFKEQLKSYLFDSPEHVHWLYHPRRDRAIEWTKTNMPDPASISTQDLFACPEDIPSESDQGDFIDRALAGFTLNRSRR
ncbi:competence protein CoiA family protein [Marinobacterium stanieri]|uniref:Competence protein CoiA-like family protein n=1 Tax=Marinobacterium stanieri TaxID=49186 RepID=A0A1N6R7R7_9GAMM|nr:competence protein CoiA family protein [Marinobacterium stanieri]SIQ24950.1 Competence protein CoiA-like family protein [Marinobacterium stanieri]